MSMIALYVYSATTFTIDSKIEPVSGPAIAAGNVTLEPGIYRLPASAKIDPETNTRGASYSIVPLDDTKTGWPDPPLQAVQEHGMAKIRNFLDGSGAQNVLR